MITLFKTVTGSQLYGTNTPTSDTDYAGVFIAEPKFYLGLEKVEEIDMSTVSKKDDGRNDNDAIDFKLYELRNYVKLALQNNPNILELMFSNKLEDVSVEGQSLIDIRHLFPWQGCLKTYIGYANSQRHKMVMRTDKHDELVKFLEMFEGKSGILLDHREKLVENKDFFVVGDISIPRASTINAARDMVRKRYDVFSGRKELISKHGMDTKFASHLIRLLYEGKELLTTGEIKFPLKYKDVCLDIKMGKYEIGEVLELAKNIEKEIYDFMDTGICSLPKKPRYDEVNNRLINTMQGYLKMN